MLTDDCYSEIIKNFEYDHQTLYNCLLVNCTFCFFTLPLLWADPLINVSKRSINVISIYLSYLNENEKHQLISSKCQVDLSCIFKKTIFEYADFLETYSSYNIKQAISLWLQYTQDISNTNLEHLAFEAIQSMLFRKSKRIKKFDISVNKDSSTFHSITSSLFSSLELRECIFSFVVLNSQSMNIDNYINTISKRNKRIQSIRIIELELDYFITSSFKYLRREMLQVKSQSIRKLVLQGIRFNKNNLAKLVPNLEVLSISCSFRNPLGEGQNSLKNLQKLELEDNDIELNKILLKAKCKALKFFIINEKELSNEVKEELVFLFSLNYPNITTLHYVTDNLMFSFTLKSFQKLRQLQLGRLAYVAPYIVYDTPYIDPQYSNHDYLLTLNKFLPASLKILNLLNIFNYSYINLNCFLQDFDIERTFIEKARFLRYIEIVRSENFNVENLKASEREIINLCQVKNIKLPTNEDPEVPTNECPTSPKVLTNKGTKVPTSEGPKIPTNESSKVSINKGPKKYLPTKVQQVPTK
ncbi:2275_t:CDS:2, partial [Gigaspora margarita]